MAGRREIRCIGPSYHFADRKAAVQRSINWRARQVEGEGEDKTLIMECPPGLLELIDFGAAVRGIFATESREFVVAGSTLYETTSGSAVSLGAITGADWVGMDDGTGQLVVAAGEDGFVLNLATNVLAQITDPDWRGSDDVAELNGTFIFIAVDGTGQFYISAIDDASSLDALDFSSADAQPDSLITVCVLKQEALFFGALSTEVWVYEGDNEFPLVRYTSTPIDIGVVGRRAVVPAADTLVFVGRTKRGTGVVYMMQGHQPVPISNGCVEEALQAGGVDLSECSLWVQQTARGEFVGLNAPGLETTWVWDAKTRWWHECGELVDGEWTPLRIESVVAFNGQHHAVAGTKLYRMVDGLGSFGTDAIVQERTWPHLVNPTAEPTNYRCLELACTTGSEVAADITLECSNDGGHVFGPPLSRSLGAVGRRMQKVRWNFLGSSNDRVFRLRKGAATPVTLHSANLDAS